MDDQACDRTLRRELCFYSAPEDGSQPTYITDDPVLKGTRNYRHQFVNVDIHDARGQEDNFALSFHGFTLLQRLDVPNIDFESPTEIKAIYLPFVQSTICSLLGNVQHIIPFDVTIRRADASDRQERPVRKMHIDQSKHGAYKRVEYELRKEPDLLQDIRQHRLRYRILNFWKPINGTIKDHPLVFADSRTVKSSDLVPVKHIYPHYVGETFAVKYGPDQRYWYWSNMGADDVVLLQCFDNIDDMAENRDGEAQAARCAHASFCLAEKGYEACSRESIEIRCIVLSSLKHSNCL